MKLLAVDPGDHTGWAFWQNTQHLVPVTGCINLSHKKDIDTQEKQLEFMWKNFYSLLITFHPDLTLIEGVKFYSGSVKSRTSAVRGNLMKLAYLIGGYMHIASIYEMRSQIINADTWKGQLPNDVVEKRVYRILKKSIKNEHSLCAVGIGLYYLGRF